MGILNAYSNGNTLVEIYSDGTKIRTYENEPIINFPESIDIKITDHCNLGCKFCHESSTTKGLHGDLNVLKEILSELPAGIEIAVGGGMPLDHPDLIEFLSFIKLKGIIANITINQGHIKEYFSLIKYLIKDEFVKGIGVSISSNNFKYVEELLKLSDNVVFHVIAGINEISILDKLISFENCKVLILGYKIHGFGIQYYNENIKENIKKWYNLLPSYIGKCIISFDNLAIEQLNVKRLFTIEGWKTFYMGDDFTFTMYIDAVKQEYAPTSRSTERTSFKDFTLIQYFSNHK